MIYTELDKIPLSRFIDVYLGDTDRVADGGTYTKKEKEEAASRLCGRYLGIVGGRQALAVTSRRNDALKVRMRLACLAACRVLICAGAPEDAVAVLGALGYPFPAADGEKMLAKVDSVEAADKYRLRKLEAEERRWRENAGNPKMDRAYFTKERVAVMSHVRMYIDADTFSAEEYAWMVKRMCDELDAAMKRANNKNKQGG